MKRLLRHCLPLLFPLGLIAAAQPLRRVNVQLDWVPEPEHGGLYQALARGFYREEGLEVVLVPGGPGAQVMPSVATGKADTLRLIVRACLFSFFASAVDLIGV